MPAQTSTHHSVKQSLLTGGIWSLLSLLIVIPVAIIAADRFLPFGGVAAFGWGPPLVGILAGIVHRDAKTGLFAALGVLVFGAVAFCVMVLLALQSLPGP